MQANPAVRRERYTSWFHRARRVSARLEARHARPALREAREFCQAQLCRLPAATAPRAWHQLWRCVPLEVRRGVHARKVRARAVAATEQVVAGVNLDAWHCRSFAARTKRRRKMMCLAHSLARADMSFGHIDALQAVCRVCFLACRSQLRADCALRRCSWSDSNVQPLLDAHDARTHLCCP